MGENTSPDGKVSEEKKQSTEIKLPDPELALPNTWQRERLQIQILEQIQRLTSSIQVVQVHHVESMDTLVNAHLQSMHTVKEELKKAEENRNERLRVIFQAHSDECKRLLDFMQKLIYCKNAVYRCHCNQSGLLKKLLTQQLFAKAQADSSAYVTRKREQLLQDELEAREAKLGGTLNWQPSSTFRILSSSDPSIEDEVVEEDQPSTSKAIVRLPACKCKECKLLKNTNGNKCVRLDRIEEDQEVPNESDDHKRPRKYDEDADDEFEEEETSL